MKKKIKIFAAILVVLGLILTACSDPIGGNPEINIPVPGGTFEFEFDSVIPGEGFAGWTMADGSELPEGALVFDADGNDVTDIIDGSAVVGAHIVLGERVYSYQSPRIDLSYQTGFIKNPWPGDNVFYQYIPLILSDGEGNTTGIYPHTFEYAIISGFDVNWDEWQFHKGYGWKAFFAHQKEFLDQQPWGWYRGIVPGFICVGGGGLPLPDGIEVWIYYQKENMPEVPLFSIPGLDLSDIFNFFEKNPWFTKIFGPIFTEIENKVNGYINQVNDFLAKFTSDAVVIPEFIPGQENPGWVPVNVNYEFIPFHIGRPQDLKSDYFVYVGFYISKTEVEKAPVEWKVCSGNTVRLEDKVTFNIDKIEGAILINYDYEADELILSFDDLETFKKAFISYAILLTIGELRIDLSYSINGGEEVLVENAFIVDYCLKEGNFRIIPDEFRIKEFTGGAVDFSASWKFALGK